MRLAQVQSAVADSIASNPVLAAFGEVLKTSLLVDDETLRKYVDDRLQATGVIIEVSAVSARVQQPEPGRLYTIFAEYEVYIAESPVTTHTPAEMNLVQAVIDQCTRQIERGVFPVLTGYDAGKNDKGTVMHAIGFSVAVNSRITA